MKWEVGRQGAPQASFPQERSQPQHFYVERQLAWYRWHVLRGGTPHTRPTMKTEKVTCYKHCSAMTYFNPIVTLIVPTSIICFWIEASLFILPNKGYSRCSCIKLQNKCCLLLPHWWIWDYKAFYISMHFNLSVKWATFWWQFYTVSLYHFCGLRDNSKRCSA